MKITVDSGLKQFELDFKDRNETEIIEFNPNDPDLAIRFSKFSDNVQAKINELKDVEVDGDGKSNNIEVLENFNKIIFNEIDVAFGNKISDKVFKYCNPLAIINGNYYIVQFMENISPIIKKSVEQENKKLEKHIGKYTK